VGSVTVTRSNPNALIDTLKTLTPGAVKIGWFPSARYDDEEKTPVAAVAAQNEYGNPSKRVPPRPFIRPAIALNENKWKDIGRRGLKAVLAKKSTTTAVLQLLGITAVGDIQASISRVYSPPLKKSTIDARLERQKATGGRRLTKNQAIGITKPLVDTGEMRATVGYEIEGGK